MSARVTGLARLTRQLHDFGQEGVRMSNAIVQSTADKVVLRAKEATPKDLGELTRSIGKEGGNGLATIFVNAPYAAYQEFGTGTKVSVPAELSEIAIKFKGKGRGSFEEFKTAIKDWMKHKGIDEKYAYVIMMSIIKNGIKPQPFLYPAYVWGRKELVDKMRVAVREMTRRYNSR